MNEIKTIAVCYHSPTPAASFCGANCIVTFNPPLERKEFEHAVITSRVRFIELVWIADLMNKHNISYIDAVRVLHKKSDALIVLDKNSGMC